MKFATVTAHQIAAMLPTFRQQHGTAFRQLQVRDDLYALPELSWLRREYRGYFRAELERLGLTKWSREDNDCDNRADLYRVQAQICKGRMRLGDGLALAVGYVEYYNTRAAGWHAINLACVAGPTLAFIEPAYETGCDVTYLSMEDQASIRLLEI